MKRAALQPLRPRHASATAPAARLTRADLSAAGLPTRRTLATIGLVWLATAASVARTLPPDPVQDPLPIR